ncbi:Uncharacterized protein TCM_045252 [Theobroma cacao]|uniref:Uncharacterized protein n=1 Tax=Theobroma cacao TaxID=3641 RepID=A0A061FSJ0_THECC|nr:Uncharacterized protein TCM_045252 [Theobroma cacao]
MANITKSCPEVELKLMVMHSKESSPRQREATILMIKKLKWLVTRARLGDSIAHSLYLSSLSTSSNLGVEEDTAWSHRHSL